jgi:hypothetical protein
MLSRWPNGDLTVGLGSSPTNWLVGIALDREEPDIGGG